MRLFKKFLLAAGAIGLISTLGFAGKAKAATFEKVTVEPEVTDNVVTWEWEGDGEGDITFDDVVGVDLKIGNWTYKATEDEIDDEEIDLSVALADLKASSTSAATIAGKVTVTLTLSYTDDDGNELTKGGFSGTTTDEIDGFYKQTVTSSDFSKGTVSVDGETKGSAYYFYAKLGETYSINANPSGSNTFLSWKEDSSLSQSASITVTKAATYTAQFDVAATGITLKGTVGTRSDSNSLTMYVGETLTLSATLIPNNQSSYRGLNIYCTDASVFDGTAGVKWKARTATVSPVEIYVELTLNDGSVVESNRLRVTINEQAYTESKFEIKCDNDYLTDSYKMDLTPNFTVKGTYTTGMIWEVVKGDVKLTGLSSSSSTGTKVTDDKGVEVTATEGKVSSGNTSDVEIKATLPKGKSLTEDLAVTYKFTVYPKNTLSYSTSDRTLTYKAPAKVNTGKTDGQDTSSDDSKKQTKTAISDIKGVKLQVFKGDESLGTTSTAKSKGTSATIEASTVEQIVTNLSSKFSGDSQSIKFRAYPCRDDDNTTYNKNVYADASTTVYRVEVTITDADGLKSTEVYYGLEGQTIDFTKNTVLKGYTISDKDGKTVTSAKVTTSSSDNKYTGVLGERKETDGSGLDKVPKTGQNNVFVYVMVAIVACAVCFGLYAYNKKSKNA